VKGVFGSGLIRSTPAYAILGARYGASGNFKLAAIGDYNSVFASTTSASTANYNRGTYWYMKSPTGSMGFAQVSAVRLNSADTMETYAATRMSWHLDHSSAGGYRAGDTSTGALYKIVMYCN
tara:strand:- start:150 stop:515 length:366 start_codon:yes stop_codon:yes gene_type:complete